MFEVFNSKFTDEEKNLKVLLGKLNWSGLKEVISNSQTMRRAYEAGGFQLRRPNVKRAVDVVSKILRESDQQTSKIKINLFLSYYQQPENREVALYLDKYFESDDYKKAANKQELKNCRYRLNNEKFQSFCSFLDKEKASLFLYFSPIIFTEEQANFLNDFSAPVGDVNDSLVLATKTRVYEDKIRSLEVALRQSSSKLVSEQKQLTKTKTELKRSASSVKTKERHLELEKTKTAELSAKVNESAKRIDSLSSASQARKKQIDKLESTLRKSEGALKEERVKSEGLNNTLQDLKNSLKKSEANYSAERDELTRIKSELRGSVSSLKISEHHLEREKAKCAELSLKLEELQNSSGKPGSDSLIENLVRPLLSDERLSSLLNNNDREISDFRSLVQKDLDVGKEISFSEFWENLRSKEEGLVKSISQLTTNYFYAENSNDKWLNAEDAFEDLNYSIQAKAVLVRLIHESFKELSHHLGAKEGESG